MDKQRKQIEEMAKVICSACAKDNEAICKRKPCSLAREEAQKVYEAGYRKIPDGDCVLNKEQNQNYEKFVLDEKEKTRKETSEKFMQKLKERFFNTAYWMFLRRDFEEIEREITEGKNANK